MFKKLENILVTVYPFVSNLKLNPPLDQVLLPWILDEIPDLLQNEVFLNVSHSR